jgi:polysaccharide biosynthesis transport protein
MDNLPTRQGPHRGEMAPRPGGHVPEPVYIGYPEQIPPMAQGAPPLAGIMDLWHILRRRKALLLIAAFLGGLGGFLLTLPQTPVYQSRSRLEIQSFNENIGNRRQSDATYGNTDVQTDIQTQIKIMQSVTLIEQVVAQLGLDAQPDTFEPPGRIAAWRRALGLREETAPAEMRARAVSMAADNLAVTSVKGTRIVELACDSTDPKMAADFLNALSKRFIEQNMDWRWESSQNTSKWWNTQLEEMKKELEKKEDALQDEARTAGLILTAEKENVAEQRLRQLNDERSKAQAELTAKQSKYETMKSRSAESLPEVLDDPSLRESAAKLADLRRQLADLDTSMTANHPKVKTILAQMAEVQKDLETNRSNILKRIENELMTAQRIEKQVSDKYEAQVKIVTDQQGRSIKYGIMKREVDSLRQRYEAMLAQVKEYAIASTMRASNIIVIDPARAPLFPYKPSLLRYCMLGLFLGLGSGIALVFIMNQADRTIQQPGDMPACTDVPELGVIPAARMDPSLRDALRHRPARVIAGADEGKSLAALVEETKALAKPEGAADGNGGKGEDNGNEGARKSIALATLQRKHSLLAEAYRATLASILFTGSNGTRPRVMLISSPGPGEGKTSSVTNLGLALAEINRRVVLIDADLRRPRLHELLDVANTRGLSDFLHERNSIEEYPIEALAIETRVPNLYVLPSGPKALSISNLLYSPRMLELIKRFRLDFDVILIDTPPMQQIADARVLGSLVDGVILVIRAGHTSRDTAVAALRRFAEDGTSVIGTILNNWDPKKTTHSGYYSHYYYSGKYNYYYSTDQK